MVHPQIRGIGHVPRGVVGVVALPPVVRQDLAVADVRDQFGQELVELLLCDDDLPRSGIGAERRDHRLTSKELVQH